MYGSRSPQTTSAGQVRRCRSRPGVGEGLGRRGAVQREDRPLRALVEVAGHLVEHGAGQRARGDVRLARQQGDGAPGGRAHEQLADHGRAPRARDPVPAVARQQRGGVHDHEPPHAPGRRIASGGHGAPVVDHEGESPIPRASGSLQPAVVAPWCRRRRRACPTARSRQVRRDPARALQERDQSAATVGDAVDVHDVAAAVASASRPRTGGRRAPSCCARTAGIRRG
jgi:hypothetical protein